MDQFLLILVSGLASGAVYGLMGLGLVIIYRATDVVNFALAGLATVGLYAALALNERGLPLLLAAVAAIVTTAAVGLVAREAVIRPLAQGELLSALVMTMGVSLIAESAISTIWDDQPRLFPSLVEGSVSLERRSTGTEPADHRRGRRRHGPGGVPLRTHQHRHRHARRRRVRRHRADPRPRIPAHRPDRLGTRARPRGARRLPVRPRAGLVPTVLSAPLFRAFAGIFLGGLTSMYGAVIGGLTVGVLDNLAAGYVSAGYRDTFVFSFTILVLLIRPQGLFGVRTFQRV